MSRPPINPDKTVAGIALDPYTLERVIPESKRPDGTVRKQIKIRPGFTPQEDMKRFRGTKQAQLDQNALPKGHIIGWAPPPSASPSSGKPLSKSAKKNAKRKEKREEQKAEIIKDSWEDDDDEINTSARPSSEKTASATPTVQSTTTSTTETLTDALASELEKLDVK